jgi:hypothetical protein
VAFYKASIATSKKQQRQLLKDTMTEVNTKIDCQVTLFSWPQRKNLKSFLGFLSIYAPMTKAGLNLLPFKQKQLQPTL